MKKEYMKKNISRVLSLALTVTLLTPLGNGAEFFGNGNQIYADTYQKTELYSAVEETASAAYIKDTRQTEDEITVAEEETSTSPEMTETGTSEIETTEPETTEPVTTEIETTEPETTEPVTTEQPTTKPLEKGVKPWGKNSLGQFVNGNKKVIKGATMKGIDVSHHQGVIDWAKVAQTDVDYAIIRCGYGDNIKSQDDKYWKENVEGCEKYNIPYGVYIYSYATTVKQAKSEVDHVLRLIKGHTLNFPIYLDMEDAVQAKLSKTRRNDIANTFLNAIHNAGYECGVYANLNWWNNYIPSDISNNLLWNKWVAQYNDNACTYQGVYQMWQSTSQGKVSGIKGDVDLNFWFGPVRTRTYNIKRYGSVAAPKPKPVTAPKRVILRSLKKGKKRATLKWRKVSGAKGYTIQYSTSKKFKNKRIKTTKKTSILIKKLKSKKTYYFRVKAYKINASKKKVYSKKWSKLKYTKIK